MIVNYCSSQNTSEELSFSLQRSTFIDLIVLFKKERVPSSLKGKKKFSKAFRLESVQYNGTALWIQSVTLRLALQ